jgi:polyketide biosynthesis acyl carrier protein
MDKAYIFSILKKGIAEIMIDVDINSITMQESLKELGMNSIDRAEILLHTMESLQVNVPMMKFATAKNIGEIVDVFKNCCESTKKA